MKKIVLLIYFTLAVFNVYSNDLDIKYIFWYYPDYSIDDSEYKSTGNWYSLGRTNSDFINIFNENELAMKQIRSGERKFMIGNLAFAVPSGVCFGIVGADAITKKFIFDENEIARYSVLSAGIILSLLDIWIGYSGYKDFEEASDLYNNDINRL